MNTTEIIIKGRTYTFTADGADEGSVLDTLGSLYNSRGKFAGCVIRHKVTGRMALIGGPSGVSYADERRGLAVLEA